MFKNLSIITKFFIPGFIVFLILVVFLTIFIDFTLQKIVIQISKSFIASTVRLQAEKLLRPENFYIENSEESEKIFNEFLDKIKTREILKTKVWDKEGNIIFSEDKNLVGKNFKDNEEFKIAITGKIETEIQKPVDDENINEKNENRLLEIYIPVFFESNNPYGIIEVYYKFDNIFNIAREFRINIFFSIALSILGLFLFIFFAFNIFIKNPLKKLSDAVYGIKKGDLNKRAEIHSNDEIGKLSESFNDMIERLNSSQKDLQKRVDEKLGPYDEKFKILENQVDDLEKIKNNLEEKLKNFI